MHLLTVSAALAASLALSGCGQASDTTPTAAQTEVAAAAPLTASGPAETLAQESDDNLQSAASVVRVDMAPNQTDLTAKLFGTAGGDPAMNGLYTYIAFFAGPQEGWRVYRIGDFLDYRILSASPGRIDLELQESTMNSATGEIGSRVRRVIVGWTPGPDGAPPTTVTLTPAR